MFTGIIETLGEVVDLKNDGENLHISISSSIAPELRIDQSVAHNGVCLTVVSVNGSKYTVTAIQETLDKSNLGDLKVGDLLNLERAMVLGDRLDGHIVQGHVDQTAACVSVEEKMVVGFLDFNITLQKNNITIEKGSITVDGVSLTVVDSEKDSFSVAIIPYTYKHTRFNSYKEGSTVNLEFDVIGKYVSRLMEVR